MASFGCKLICSFDKNLCEEAFTYQGEDAGVKFIEYLIDLQKRSNKLIKDLRKKYKYHHLSNEEERKKIAKSGMLRALREHTYDKRLTCLLETVFNNERGFPLPKIPY